MDNNPDTYLKNISGDLQDYAAMAACMMIENNRPLSVILGYLTQEERYILAGKVKGYGIRKGIEVMIEKAPDVKEAKYKVIKILALREKAYRERLEATTLEAKNQAQQKIVGYNRQITGVIEDLEKRYIYHKGLTNKDVRDIQRTIIYKLGLKEEEGWLV